MTAAHANNGSLFVWTDLQEVRTEGRDGCITFDCENLGTGKMQCARFGVKRHWHSPKESSFKHNALYISGFSYSIEMTFTGVRNKPSWQKCYGMWLPHGMEKNKRSQWMRNVAGSTGSMILSMLEAMNDYYSIYRFILSFNPLFCASYALHNLLKAMYIDGTCNQCGKGCSCK